MRNVKSEPRTILSEPYVVDLITFVDKKGTIQALDLMSVSKSYYHMFNLARELEEEGILKVFEKRAPRLTYTIKLTSKGEKIAEKLQEAKELLDGKQ